MYSKFFTLAIVLFSIGTFFNSCQSPDRKFEIEQNFIQQANNELVEAHMKLNQMRYEYLQFKKDSEIKVSYHEKSLAEFNVQTTKEKMAKIELKNKELGKKLENYEDQGRANWLTFKKEFNHEIDDLGKAFKELTDDSINWN